MGFAEHAYATTAFAGAHACAGGGFSSLAFSKAFSAGSCDGGAVRRTFSLPIEIVVSDDRVFDTSVGVIFWSLLVSINGVDVSRQLTGELSIEAAEDAARVATLSLLIESADQLLSLDSAPITVDVIIKSGDFVARRRRFTGVVELVVFSPADRVASITCRDGYQERIRACVTSGEVFSLLNGMAVVADPIVPWDDGEPDPVGYFYELLGTVLGATIIDGNGVWQVITWSIDAAEITYEAADMFDPGPTVRRPSRVDVPSAIVATLTHTFQRLHSVSIPLHWSGLGGLDYTERGINPPQQTMIMDALTGLADWHVVGKPEFTNFDPVSWPVRLSMTATLRRRWYQEVVRRYTVTIDMGGASERDASVARSISSDFDADRWESNPDQNSLLDVYAANPPGPPPPPVEVSPGPYPPENGALDHFGFDYSVLDKAVRQVVAEAARKAAQGRRKQTISFSRPVDLRLEIGSVAGVNAYGVRGVGQVKSWREVYSFDSGACIGDYLLACPDGNGVSTAFDVSLQTLAPGVLHALSAPELKNWVGGSARVTTYPQNTNDISGHLTNVLFGAAEYDDSLPRFVEQFRIVTPDIGAKWRDPLAEDVSLDVSVTIAGSGVQIEVD